MKVAHILSSLNPGGVETWLKDLSKIKYLEDVYVYTQTTEVGFLEEEIEANGFNIRKLPINRWKIKYMINLFNTLKSDQIDIVHSHVNFSSGWILIIAYLAGVKKRIAHVHNNHNASFFKNVYHLIMRFCIKFFATDLIAVSSDNALICFGTLKNVNVIPCGINLTPDDSSISRASLGLEESDFVILHVGRFVEQKNHEFILKIMNDMPKDSSWKILLIGDGPLRNNILDHINSDDIICLGLRNDVLHIMKNIADFFILPSIFEGLGLVAIEAQCSGLYTLVSNAVPEEVIVSNRIEFLSIDDHSLWVERLSLLSKSKVNMFTDLELFNYNQFTVEYNAKKIIEVYESNSS